MVTANQDVSVDEQRLWHSLGCDAAEDVMRLVRHRDVVHYPVLAAAIVTKRAWIRGEAPTVEITAVWQETYDITESLPYQSLRWWLCRTVALACHPVPYYAAAECARSAFWTADDVGCAGRWVADHADLYHVARSAGVDVP